MNLLDSLLDAIVRLDGDALVMHVGEKPYVVTTSEATNEFRGPLAWGQVELSSRVLTSEAVVGMLGQILPIDQRAALDEYGAIDYEVAAANDPAEKFTIVAARGGDDIWLEVRRQSKLTPEPAIVVPAAEPEVVPAAEAEGSSPADDAEGADIAPEPEPVLPVSGASDYSEMPVANEPTTVYEQEPEVQEPELQEAGDGFVPDIEQSLEAQPREAIPVSVTSDDDVLLIEDVEDVEAIEDDAALSAAADAIAGDEDWGDDVMTEGDLSELLRAKGTVTFRPIVETKCDCPPSAAVTPAQEAVNAAHEALMFAQGIDPAEADAPIAIATLLSPREASHTDGGISPQSSDETLEPVREQETPTVAFDDVVPPAQQELARLPRIETVSAADQPAAADETAGATVAPDRAAIAAEVAPQPAEPTFEAIASEEHAMPDDSQTEFSTPVFRPASVNEPVGSDDDEAPIAPVAPRADEEDGAPSRPAAVVLSLTRQPRPDAPPDIRGGAAATLQRLLRLAAARGAMTVYVVAQSAPMVRVDGEFSVLDGEPTLNTAFVERLLAELTPQTRDAAQSPSAEWIADVPEIGRVRCVTFRDHRGPGIIFRMVPPRAISADQLGLSAEVQALCT
ncbi:MAG: hypothetical protein ACRD15_13260, partial [Vicinamibacterales bacterium]